jgi:hypothetical protein
MSTDRRGHTSLYQAAIVESQAAARRRGFRKNRTPALVWKSMAGQVGGDSCQQYIELWHRSDGIKRSITITTRHT